MKFSSLLARPFRLFGLLCALLLIAACDGPEQREAAHFERGKTFLEEGNLTKASLEFRNVLQINPRSVEGRYHLALVAEAQGNFERAFADYTKAAQQDSQHIPSLIKIGQYYLFGNRIEEARENAEAVLAIDPKNVEGLALQGAVLTSLDDYEGAHQHIDGALSQSPQNMAAVSAMVGLFQTQGRFDEAIEVVDLAIGFDPEEQGFHILKIQLLVDQDELDRAVEIYQSLIEQDPANVEFKAALADLLIRQEKLDEAEAVLRQLVFDNPTDPMTTSYMVAFLLDNRDLAYSEDILSEFVKSFPNEKSFGFALAELYLRADQTDKAIEIYQSLFDEKDKSDDALAARVGLAGLFQQQGEGEKANRLIDEVLTADPNMSDALFMRAARSIEDENLQRAISDLRTLLRNHPGNASARLLLAEAHLRNGESDLAVEAFRQYLAVVPDDLEIMVTMSRELAAIGSNNSALEVLGDALEQAPDHAPALLLRARILFAQGDWTGLLDGAGALIDNGDMAVDGYALRGFANLELANHAQAAQDFESALQLDPENLEHLSGLLQAHIESGNIDLAQSMVDDRLSKDPDDALLYALQSDVLIAKEDWEGAEAALAKAIELGQLISLPYLNLARLYMRLDQPQEAEQILRRGIDILPDDSSLAIELAAVLTFSGEYEKAITAYEIALEQSPENMFVSNNLASLIADFQFQDQERLNRALNLIIPYKDTDDPFVQATLGWVHYRFGRVEEALAALQSAANRLPDEPQIQYHLGMAYLAADDKEKARALLQKAVSDEAAYPGKDDARKMLAQL
ncbi:MAG: tetratricopeptide repeat protein [Pseudomonadota bacterium]